jgi:hypothetical protein
MQERNEFRTAVLGQEMVLQLTRQVIQRITSRLIFLLLSNMASYVEKKNDLTCRNT